ncbi:ribose 5-phosphate isomerase B [candidate division WOR-3 bacterium]|uniref:Ribose 5-phosphate isomerase B n=1 Tax=candidate division WOR-3 bacterium TaxID=2052148 RepID=A0A937XHD7_UNCW3|nr:ribose 5-phosphate isomerase B [candidate division WOR-3 bacterium]
MKVALGADHRGFALKEELKRWLTARGHTVVDCGPDSVDRVDYPDYAFKVAGAVARDRADRGVLICSTGIGMCIAANKVRGVRAALADSVRLARLSREHNDSNVLCLGADVVTGVQARRIVGVWLGAEFAGGRHSLRLDKIARYR